MDSTYYKDMQISPEVQLERDKEALSLLLKERTSGISDVPGLLVNVSKNPAKVLYKDKGIEGEIARRKIIMASLQKQLATPSPTLITNTSNTPVEEAAVFSPLLTVLASLFNQRK